MGTSVTDDGVSRREGSQGRVWVRGKEGVLVWGVGVESVCL